jgi:hypothetical protein
MWLPGDAGEVVAFVQAILRNAAVSPSMADAVATMQVVEVIGKAPDGLSKVDVGGAG